MPSRTRFPDQISTVGGLIAAMGAVQAVYFFVVKWSLDNLEADKFKGDLPQTRLALNVYILLGVLLVVAGIGLMGKRRWAWWASAVLLPLTVITADFEMASGSSRDIGMATPFPEPLATTAAFVLGIALTVVLVRMRPRSPEPPKRISDVEHVDPRAMAAMEATRKLSSRKPEDWGADDDNEELLESLAWMAQLRQKDISKDETQEQQEVEERIGRLPAVIDASPMAIAICDKTGLITLWNTAAQRLLGFSQMEMLGKPLPLGALEDGMDPGDLLELVANDGSLMGISSSQTTKTGSTTAVSMSISALPDITGGTGGFMLVMADRSSKDGSTDDSDRGVAATSGLTDEEWANSAHGQHARRVTIIAELVALELGFSEQDAAKIGRASMPHDIGKVGVSGEIWSKKGRLTDEEFDSVKTHTKVGGDMLASTQSPLLKMAADIAYAHHERWDGHGYLRLRGDEIPIGARIVAVADAFDAITHDRPYRAARTVGYAAAELKKESGNQFDPSVVDAFLKLLEMGRLESVTSEAPIS